MDPSRQAQFNFILATYGRPIVGNGGIPAPRPADPTPRPASQVKAQIICWIDGAGVIHVEAPGKNGHPREKLDLDVGPALRAELSARAIIRREQERADAIARHREVFDLTARMQGRDFARRHIGAVKSALRKDGFTESDIAEMESAVQLDGMRFFFSTREMEARANIAADEAALGRPPAAKIVATKKPAAINPHVLARAVALDPETVE